MHILSYYTARNTSAHTKTELEDGRRVLFGGHHVLFGYPGNTLLERHDWPAMSPGTDEVFYRPLPHYCRSYLGHLTPQN